MHPSLPSRITALACLVLLVAASLFSSCAVSLPFVSKEDLSPACLDAAYKYIEDVTLEENVRSPYIDEVINHAFTTGGTFYISVKTPDGDDSKYTFYFSQEGADMYILLYSVVADVRSSGGGHTIVNVDNNMKGTNRRKLPCAGPFHGEPLKPDGN